MRRDARQDAAAAEMVLRAAEENGHACGITRIAAQAGCTWRFAKKVLSGKGISVTKRKTSAAVSVDAIVAEHNKGARLSDIARSYGVSRQYIWKLVHDAGYRLAYVRMDAAGTEGGDGKEA